MPIDTIGITLGPPDAPSTPMKSLDTRPDGQPPASSFGALLRQRIPGDSDQPRQEPGIDIAENTRANKAGPKGESPKKLPMTGYPVSYLALLPSGFPSQELSGENADISALGTVAVGQTEQSTARYPLSAEALSASLPRAVAYVTNQLLSGQASVAEDSLIDGTNLIAISELPLADATNQLVSGQSLADGGPAPLESDTMFRQVPEVPLLGRIFARQVRLSSTVPIVEREDGSGEAGPKDFRNLVVPNKGATPFANLVGNTGTLSPLGKGSAVSAVAQTAEQGAEPGDHATVDTTQNPKLAVRLMGDHQITMTIDDSGLSSRQASGQVVQENTPIKVLPEIGRFEAKELVKESSLDGVHGPEIGLLAQEHSMPVSGEKGVADTAQGPERSTLSEQLEKMVDQVRAVHVTGGETAEMHVLLEPKELGRLSLRISMENGLISARFDAASHAVKQLIEAELPRLKDTLHQQGVQLEQVSVQVGADSSGGFQQSARETPIFHSPRRGNRPPLVASMKTTMTVASVWKDTGHTIDYIV